jgi:hypothetical protein
LNDRSPHHAMMACHAAAAGVEELRLQLLRFRDAPPELRFAADAAGDLAIELRGLADRVAALGPAALADPVAPPFPETAPAPSQEAGAVAVGPPQLGGSAAAPSREHST